MNRALNLFESSIEKVADTSYYPPRDKEIKRIIEALLFASNEALSLEKIREIIHPSYPIRSKEVHLFIEQLSHEYQEQNRAFRIDYIAGGYLLRTDPEMQPYLEQLYQDRRSDKLSQAAAEVLAVIAYRGPITRREIEKLRGVDCSGVVAALIERGLIEAVGRKEAPGRPVQYGVTQKFLQHFGLNGRADLLTSV